ncbi:MAG TPA: MmcQ/YjbR family DNA-binding protein [Acidimicrobiia bacterium]|nr:MmcQ/YjbR family DNA-binding protein [Acidimicrobiia bacterium]
MPDRPEVPNQVVAKLAKLCLALPEVFQEDAWVGTRWKVRKETFAHVLMIADGWPPAYVKAAGTEGPACVLTFRAPIEELDAMRGAPFFKPVWFADVVGLFLDDGTDWTEVRELVTDSYCILAPKKLAALVDRPDG